MNEFFERRKHLLSLLLLKYPQFQGIAWLKGQDSGENVLKVQQSLELLELALPLSLRQRIIKLFEVDDIFEHSVVDLPNDVNKVGPLFVKILQLESPFLPSTKMNTIHALYILSDIISYSRIFKDRLIREEHIDLNEWEQCLWKLLEHDSNRAIQETCLEALYALNLLTNPPQKLDTILNQSLTLKTFYRHLVQGVSMQMHYETLLQCRMFSLFTHGVSDEVIIAFLHISSHQIFEANTSIAQDIGISSLIYFILGGNVQLTGPIEQITKEAGEIIGLREPILYQQQPHKLISVSECSLLVIERQDFLSFIEDYPELVKPVFHAQLS